MKSNAGKIIVACCVLCAVGIFIGLFLKVGGWVQAQTITDVGKFKVGSVLGMERSGFTGRPMLQVFTDSSSPDWPLIQNCLQSPEVEAEMGFYTGVLVD